MSNRPTPALRGFYLAIALITALAAYGAFFLGYLSPDVVPRVLFCMLGAAITQITVWAVLSAL